MFVFNENVFVFNLLLKYNVALLSKTVFVHTSSKNIYFLPKACFSDVFIKTKKVFILKSNTHTHTPSLPIIWILYEIKQNRSTKRKTEGTESSNFYYFKIIYR